MRNLIAVILLIILGISIMFSIKSVPFGNDKSNVGKYYLSKAVEQTGSANAVTSVVVAYRGFDTLGEVTILFVAAMGLGAVLYMQNRQKLSKPPEPPSLILNTGCRLLFPLILLFGTYIFLHGHLTPGGGFQGGAVIASGFLLIYFGCTEKKIKPLVLNITESVSGLIFIIVGLIGLAAGGFFLMNFLPVGSVNTFFSAGVIPVIYIAIGFKVGSELAGIIGNLMEHSQ
jgi:multicomponent Na+:H+ antiporter subunit B